MRDEGANERGHAWLRPPALVDPGDARVAATVQFLSLCFSVAIVAWGVAAVLLLRRTGVLPVPASLLGVMGVAYLLAHRGWPRLAAGVLVSGIWLATTWAVAITGSVNSPALSAYLIVILSAGLLGGGAAAVATASLSAAAALALALLDSQGRLPQGLDPSPWSVIATELTLFVAAAALLWDALRRQRSAVSRAERSEAHTRALIDQASDAIVVLDADGNVLEASARASELSGYSREELSHMRFAELIEGEEPDAAASPREPGSDAVVRELWLRRKDATRLPVENSKARLSDGRIQCIVRDVSARKRAEAMQERLRSALDEAGEGIILFDADQRLLYANRAFRRLYGSREVLQRGAHVDTIADTPEYRAFWDRARRDLAQGRSFTGRFERRRPKRPPSVLHATLAPVHDGAGEPAGFVGCVRDITREAALEESVQLTRRLDAVGQLAAGLVHDFNNLLTVILGSAEALRAEAPSRDVEEIIEASQRAADLTTKLASFSRGQIVRSTRVDLNRVVRDAAGLLQRLVRENVAVELKLASQPLWVEADPSQLQQVLVNLATNARDAMPEGGTLEVATAGFELSRATCPARVRLPDGPYVLLSVRDTGEGMSEEVIEHAFEPFFTTRAPGRGTGLGLASVQDIVQQSGGAIDVQSEPGKGALLRIFLPRGRAPEAHAERSSEAAAVARPASARVLVVEDEALLRGLVTRSLASRGHHVVTAQNAAEALDLALAQRPDLLVTDVVLPDLDGRQLAAQLRERDPSLRVLFTSGYEPEEVGGAIGSDARTRFLPKPFSMSRLLDGVDRLLGDLPSRA